MGGSHSHDPRPYYYYGPRPIYCYDPRPCNCCDPRPYYSPAERWNPSREEPKPEVEKKQVKAKEVEKKDGEKKAKDGEKKGKDGEKKKEEKPKIQTVEIRLHLCCDNCVQKVEAKVRDMEGVVSVECCRQSWKVTVTGDVKPDHVLTRVRKVKRDAELC